MELVQMVTQTQESAFIMPGMSDAVAVPIASADLSLFATLLQEMLPPALATAGAVTQGAVTDAEAAQEPLIGKGKINLKSVPVTEEAGSGADEEQSDQGVPQLALLLAATGQAAGFQYRPQPDTKPVAVSEPSGVAAAAGEVTGAPVSPVYRQFFPDGERAVGIPKQDTGLTTLPEPPAQQGLTAVPKLAPETAGRMSQSEETVTKATAAMLTREDGGEREIVRHSTKTAVVSDSEESGNVIAGQQQTRQTLGKIVLAAGTTGVAPEAAMEPALLLQNALPARNSEASSGAVQAQAMPAPAAPFTPDNRIDAARPGKSSGQIVAAPAKQATAAGAWPLSAGQVLTVHEGRGPLPLQGAGNSAGRPVGDALDVGFVDSSPKMGGTEKGEIRENVVQVKGTEGLPISGIAAPRNADLPEPDRPALRTNGTEARNALHESILAQVREGVVSHDGRGNGRMTVRLNPLELGELQINVRIEAQQVKVEVISDNRMVREALMGNLDALKETLLKQNLNMEGFAVSTGGGNGSNQLFRDEKGDQRNGSRSYFGGESGPHDAPPGKAGVVWGGEESSLVDLRL